MARFKKKQDTPRDEQGRYVSRLDPVGGEHIVRTALRSGNEIRKARAEAMKYVMEHGKYKGAEIPKGGKTAAEKAAEEIEKYL